MTIVDTHTHVISPDTARYPTDPIGGRQSTWSQAHPVDDEGLIHALDEADNHESRCRAGLYGLWPRQPLPQRQRARTPRPLRRGVLDRCDRPGCGGEDPALAGGRPTRVPAVHHRHHAAGPGRLAGPRKFPSSLGICRAARHPDLSADDHGGAGNAARAARTVSPRARAARPLCPPRPVRRRPLPHGPPAVRDRRIPRRAPEADPPSARGSRGRGLDGPPTSSNRW